MNIIDRGIAFDAKAAPPQNRFCTFTSLTCLADGRLLAGFRTGSGKDSTDGDVKILLGDSEGDNWNVVFDGFSEYPPGSGGRIRAVGLAEIEPKHLFASFLWIDRSDPSLPLANPETQGILPTVLYVAESEDAGRSWSSLRTVDLRPHRGNATTGDPLLLDDGSIAVPYEAWKDYYDQDPGEHHAALRLSADRGKTWSGPQIVAHDDDGRLLFWDQRLACGPDGSLVALFWTHDRVAGQDVPIHIAWGSADGTAWSQPRSTGISGQIAAPVILPDGRLFAAYVHRHDPPSLRVILSEDRGKSWQDEIVFYEKHRGGSESGMGGQRDFADYWEDMGIWTFGHPAPALLPNGDVMVAYYAGDQQAMSIHWVRIALD